MRTCGLPPNSGLCYVYIYIYKTVGLLCLVLSADHNFFYIPFYLQVFKSCTRRCAQSVGSNFTGLATGLSGFISSRYQQFKLCLLTSLMDNDLPKLLIKFVV